MPSWVSLSVPTKITCKRLTEYNNNLSPLHLYAVWVFLYPQTKAMYTQTVPYNVYTNSTIYGMLAGV